MQYHSLYHDKDYAEEIVKYFARTKPNIAFKYLDEYSDKKWAKNPLKIIFRKYPKAAFKYVEKFIDINNSEEVLE